MAHVGPLAGKDIDALWTALRPRILGLMFGGSGIVGPQGPPGPKGVVWKDAWTVDTDYETGDIVTNTTAAGVTLTFFCIVAHTSWAAAEPQADGDERWAEINPGYLITDGSRPYVIDPAGHIAAEGQAWWDGTAGIERLVYDLAQGQVGRSFNVYARVQNNHGAQIEAGRAVHVTGAGVEPWLLGVDTLGSDGGLGSSVAGPSLAGVTLHSIPDGERGWVCIHGLVTGPDFSAFAGATVYADDGVTGEMSDTPPESACERTIKMGWILDPSNPGAMWVEPVYMPIMGELSDADLATVALYDVPIRLPPPDPESSECEGWRDYPASLFPVRTVDADADVEEKDVFIHVDAAGGAVVLTLPDMTSPDGRSGRVVHFKKIDASRNLVTITGTGQQIDGEDEHTLALPFEHVTVSADVNATEWRIIARALNPEHDPIQSGFTDRADTSLTFDDGTLTLTLEVVGAWAEVWSEGKRHVQPTGFQWQQTITDDEGVWFLYIDGAGDLIATQTFSSDIITLYAFVAAVYWDDAANAHIYLGDERHGREMDGITHLYLHNAFGTRYGSGLGLSDIVPDGDGSTDAQIQCSVADGTIWDEDLRHEIEDGNPQTLAAPAEIPLFYRSGASGDWRKIAATGEMVTPTGTGRAAWNNINAGGAGVWGLSETTNPNFTLTHVFATNDIENPIIAIVGQAEYATLQQARDGALAEILTLSLGELELLSLEFKAIGTLIFQTSNGYGNSVKSRIRTTVDGDDYIDWRTSAGSPAGASSVSAHNNLTGIQGGTASERYHLTAAEQAIAIDPLFQRGGAFLSPAGALAVVAWRAPYACEVLNVRGYRAGGTGATINAQKNGASTHLSSDLSLSSAAAWMDGGAVQNTTYAAGDSLELMLQSVVGGPTQVVVQVDFRRTG